MATGYATKRLERKASGCIAAIEYGARLAGGKSFKFAVTIVVAWALIAAAST